MAISEAARSDLYTGLSDVIGPERAETLMSAIPLHDLDEVATKGDLALLRADVADFRRELESKMAGLRTEMADLKTDMANLRTELKTEMANLRTELKTDMANLRTELKTDVAAEVGALRKSVTRWMLTLLVVIIGAMASLSFIT